MGHLYTSTHTVEVKIFLDLLSRPLFLRALIDRILGPEPPGWRTGKGGWRTGKGGYGPPGDTTEPYLLDGRLGGDANYSHKDDPAAPLTDPLNKEAVEVEMGRCLVSIDERLHRLETGYKGQPQMQQAQDWPASQTARSTLEWKMVAVVMDRIYFVFYVTALVLSAVIFFPRPAEVP